MAALRAKEGLGYLWLRGHCCLAGGLCSWKPTPNVFSFAEKVMWAEEALCALALATHPYPARAGPT